MKKCVNKSHIMLQITIRSKGDLTALYEYLQGKPEALTRLIAAMNPNIPIENLTLMAMRGRKGDATPLPKTILGEASIFIALCDVYDDSMTRDHARSVNKTLQALNVSIWNRPGAFRIWFLNANERPFKFRALGNSYEERRAWAMTFTSLLSSAGIPAKLVRSRRGFHVHIASCYPRLMVMGSNEAIVQRALQEAPRVFRRVNVRFIPLPQRFIEINVKNPRYEEVGRTK